MVEADAFYKYIELCIPDLYRMAFCVFGRQEQACDLVMKACVEGARQFPTSRAERELKIELTKILYRRCLLCLWLYPPDADRLPVLLRSATRRERLHLAVRFAAGLRSEEARQVTGLTKEAFYQRLAHAARQVAGAIAIDETVNRERLL